MNERLQAAVGAKIGEFKRKMKEVNAITKQTAMGATKKLDADTSEFRRKMAAAYATTKAFPRKVTVEVEARVARFQGAMSRLANVIRSFSEVGRNMIGGGLMTFFPALVPMVASLTGALGAAGVSLGVVSGGLLGLGSSASMAAAGFGGLLAVMIPTISRLSEAHTAIQEGERAMSSYSQPIQSVLQNVAELRNQFTQLVDSVQPNILSAFSTGLEVAQLGLSRLTPGIQNVVKAFDGLMTTFQDTVKNAKDVRASFRWFTDRADDAFRNWAKIAGNALRGVMNLFRAFDPLAQTMEKGLGGMTKRFAEWTAGLGESEKFNRFIDYIKTNGPKLLSIFGDLTQGLVGMFSAFAPLSADMLTGLQKMMSRFKEWGQTLANNQQFQKFTDYIRQNGPKVVDLIGNITNFLVNLGVGMAPLGSKLLEIANGFFQWFNGMMQAHPMIGKILAGIISAIGVFRMFTPLIIGLRSIFSGAFGKMLTKFIPFRTQLVAGIKVMLKNVGRFIKRIPLMAATFIKTTAKMLKRAVVWAARMAAQWVIAMGPIGWITTAVVALVALVIANWDKVSKWTKKAWSAVSKAVSNAVDKVMGWIEKRFPAMYEVIKNYMDMALSNIKEVWRWIKESFQNALKFLKSLVTGDFKGMKEAIQAQMENSQKAISRIWNNVKGFFGKILGDILSALKNQFSNMVTAVRNKMSDVRTWIENKWNDAQSFLEGIDLVQIGKNIIDGLVSGIESALGSVKAAVSGLADKIPGWLKKVLGIASPSRVIAKKVGRFVPLGLVKGINSEEKSVEEAASDMAEAAVPDMSDSIASNEQTLREFSDTLVSINQRAQSEIAKVKKDAREDDTKGQKDVRREIDGILDQRLSDVQSFISDKKDLEQLSVKDEVAIWSKAVNEFEDGTDRKREAQLELRDAKRAVDKQMLESELNYIEEKKRLGKISLADEVRMLEQLSNRYAQHSDKYKQIQEQRASVLETINSRLTSLNDEYLKKTKEVNQELIAEEKRLTQEYEKAVQDRADALYSTTGLFDEMNSSFEGSGDDLMENLRGQVASFEQWSKDLQQLTNRGLDDSLIGELQEMGPSAQKEIAALNKMSDKQLTEYENLWQEKSKLARQQAVKELEGMRLDTQKKIQQLHVRSKEQLETLRKEWVKKIEGVTKGTEDELSSLKQIGADSIRGLMNGMESMEDRLMRKARSMARAVSREISSALDVHSPSRVTMKIGEYTGQGLIKGIDKSIAGVKAVSRDMARAAMPEIATPNVGAVNPSFAMGDFSATDERKQHVTVILDSDVIGRGVAPAVGDEIEVRTGVR